MSLRALYSKRGNPMISQLVIASFVLKAWQSYYLYIYQLFIRLLRRVLLAMTGIT